MRAAQLFQKPRDGKRAIRAIKMNARKINMKIASTSDPGEAETIKPEISSVKTAATKIARPNAGSCRVKARRVSAALNALACRSMR